MSDHDPHRRRDAGVLCLKTIFRDGLRALPRELESFLVGACPVIGSYGAKDRTLRGAATKLDVALTTAGVVHDVKQYPDAGHSFPQRPRPLRDADAVPPLRRRDDAPVGTAYHQPSAEDARRRIVAFFDEHLGGVRSDRE